MHAPEISVFFRPVRGSERQQLTASAGNPTTFCRLPRSACPQSWVSVRSGASGHPMTALKEVLFLEAAFPRPPRAWTQKPSPCQGGGLRIYLIISETHLRTSGKARVKVPEAQDHGFNRGTCLFRSLLLTGLRCVSSTGTAGSGSRHQVSVGRGGVAPEMGYDPCWKETPDINRYL